MVRIVYFVLTLASLLAMNSLNRVIYVSRGLPRLSIESRFRSLGTFVGG